MTATLGADLLFDQLVSIVGENHVLAGSSVSERATHFWDPTPLVAKAIVRPKNTEETAQVLKACHTVGQSVVTHGGVTGLVNGNLTGSDDVIISTERQTDIAAVDEHGQTLLVGAGAKLQHIQEAAQRAHLQFGLDLGARGTCTIGGNIATNAGGLSVLRYGMTREQVLGLEVVLADGTVLSSLNPVLKNNTGYDLKQLFIGSEGTLGIITKAMLRLRPATPYINTAMAAFASFDQMSDFLKHISRETNGNLDAFEAIWQPFYQLNTNPLNDASTAPPLPASYPLYAIVETRGANKEGDETVFQNAFEQAFNQGLLQDAVIAQSEKERASIWHIREHIDSALEHDPLFVYDVSLPIAEMNQYLENMIKRLEQHWPGVVVYVYGHLADGNLHILIAPPLQETIDSRTKQQWQELSNIIVYEPLAKIGGSISAEHGIGISKKPYLAFTRSAEEITIMKQLKRTLDPNNILNPGKVVSIN